MCLYSMDKYLVEETKESQSFVEKALSIKKKSGLEKSENIMLLHA